jgi:hypothetical protein
LVSHEHFMVDGTLTETWASHKSFVRGDGSGHPPEGGKRRSDLPVSRTDPPARLFEKSAGERCRLCYLGQAMKENRQGLVGDVEATQASGTAEREAAIRRVRRRVRAGGTLGAHQGHDAASFVQAMWVTPLGAAKRTGSAMDERTKRHAGYAAGLRKRKGVEEIFDEAKSVGGLRKTRFVGWVKVTAPTVFTLAGYKPPRLATLSG